MGHSTRQLSPGRRIRFFIFLCWLYVCQIAEMLPVLAPRAHWQGRDPMAPTPRKMIAVVFGMAGVLVVSLSFADGDFPVALLYMPALYMAYVAGLLRIRAHMLKHPIRTGR